MPIPSCIYSYILCDTGICVIICRYNYELNPFICYRDIHIQIIIVSEFLCDVYHEIEYSLVIHSFLFLVLSFLFHILIHLIIQTFSFSENMFTNLLHHVILHFPHHCILSQSLLHMIDKFMSKVFKVLCCLGCLAA